MIEVQKLGVILGSTRHAFERKAVLNPACVQDGESIHVFYRAVDMRHVSRIGYAKLRGPTEVIERRPAPVIVPTRAYEKKGVEDPSITKIGATFHMTYVAHDGKNAVTAHATSRNLTQFVKKGIISPRITYDQAATIFRKNKLKDRYFMFEAFYEEFAGEDVLLWEKDVEFFPKKIGGKFALIHRILPDIQIAYFNSFADLRTDAFWKRYLKSLAKFVVLENKYWFESRNIGGGAPPIETKDGWLLIFHTVEELNKQRIYHASAALLDKRNPLRVIGRLTEPLFSPDREWEKHGMVNNVVFPTGTAQFGDDLYVYYGAADTSIAVARVSLSQLLRTLKYNGAKTI
ncbi:MAG: pesticidal protein Cry7Aa [Candidatus Liptonbacteria bacterium]|nr:pesticidal protein Cry7Aa [Candidatus Liptonbacteria bacterium]